jgi:hypothetical protein
MASRLTLVSRKDIYAVFARTELNKSILKNMSASEHISAPKLLKGDEDTLVFRVYVRVVECVNLDSNETCMISTSLTNYMKLSTTREATRR